MNVSTLIYKLLSNRTLSHTEYEQLITCSTTEDVSLLKELACRERDAIFGKSIFTRGLIEFTNYCRNDCLYCGIRCSNKSCDRYRLSESDILSCTDEGYRLGFRTFVLQGGEDLYYTDDALASIVSKIKASHPDCAITLSIGERSYDSYKRLFDAGATRYLLRHETADKSHYSMLHPAKMSFDNRMKCLLQLKEIGYQVGCGFMVGSPYQTPAHIAQDLKFIEQFKPHMIGIGPFLPHKDTPFAQNQKGSFELTLMLISILRLLLPDALIPATTALGTIDPLGREQGIMSGANVLMPNLSPVSVRDKYSLYDNKICTGEESAQCRGCLESRMNKIGFTLSTSKGDHPDFVNKGDN